MNREPNDNERRFPGNNIHHTAVIGLNVTMGTGNYIGPYCVIGMPGEHREKWGEDKGVMICSNNVFTGHITIDAGIEVPTLIENNVFIMKHAHVGHDATICDRATISCGAKVGGHTVVGNDANIGLNAVIHQKHDVAPWCMIGMGAVLPLKVNTVVGHTYVGNPVRCIGRNKKAPKHLFTKNRQPNESSSPDAQL